MESNKIIGLSILGGIGVVVGLLSGVIISNKMNKSYIESNTTRESNFGTIGDSDSSTIPNASFSDSENTYNQFKDEGLTDYSEGVNLPRGGKSKNKKKPKRKKTKKNIKL